MTQTYQEPDELKEEFYQFLHDRGDKSAPRGIDVIIADWWLQKLEDQKQRIIEIVGKERDGFNGYEYYHEPKVAEAMSEGYILATEHLITKLKKI